MAYGSGILVPHECSIPRNPAHLLTKFAAAVVAVIQNILNIRKRREDIGAEEIANNKCQNHIIATFLIPIKPNLSVRLFI